MSSGTEGTDVLSARAQSCARPHPDGDDARGGERAEVDAILAGDEAAFLSLVRRWNGPMVCVARCYLESDAVAEEVARSAWRTVLATLARRELRSSLGALVFGIVAARARERAGSDVPARSLVPVASSAGARQAHPGEPPSPAPCGEAEAWADGLATSDALVALRQAAEALPPMQRAAFTLRDVVGCTPQEASEILDVEEDQQRALLHRARGRVRDAMETHLRGRSERSLRAAGEAR